MSRAHRSYTSYIQLQALLSCQKPTTPRDDALTWGAERFFIICHQTSEIWLSQILIDLEQAARLVDTPVDWPNIRTVLTRAASMTIMLSRNIEQLAQLCPRSAFLNFRTALEGLSAGESQQFQEIFQLIGNKHPHLRRIESALAQQNACSEPNAPRIPGGCEHDECASADALRILVKGVMIWRQFHLLVAKYFIGDLPGTGGTSGVDYLLRQLANDTVEKAALIGEDANRFTRPAYSSTAAPLTIESLRSELQMLEQDVHRWESQSSISGKLRSFSEKI